MNNNKASLHSASSAALSSRSDGLVAMERTNSQRGTSSSRRQQQRAQSHPHPPLLARRRCRKHQLDKQSLQDQAASPNNNLKSRMRDTRNCCIQCPTEPTTQVSIPISFPLACCFSSFVVSQEMLNMLGFVLFSLLF